MHGPRSFGVIVCRSEKKKRYRRRFAGAAATCSYIIWSYIWSHQPCHGGSSCRYTLRPIQPLIGRGPELGPVWQRSPTCGRLDDAWSPAGRAGGIEQWGGHCTRIGPHRIANRAAPVPPPYRRCTVHSVVSVVTHLDVACLVWRANSCVPTQPGRCSVYAPRQRCCMLLAGTEGTQRHGLPGPNVSPPQAGSGGRARSIFRSSRRTAA